jgi:hypothetical protein
MTGPAHEHLFKASIIEQVYYPDHTRVATPTFTKTKRDGKRNHDVCAISGQAEGIEYHHLICEDAFTDGVDWATVKDIATGKLRVLPVLDLDTDLPTGEFYPVEKSFLWVLIQITIWRGFDWEAFDPAVPETFVDSAANMLVLHEKFHRSPTHGIHRHTLSIWSMLAFPRVKGYVWSPDELAARHGVRV